MMGRSSKVAATFVEVPPILIEDFGMSHPITRKFSMNTTESTVDRTEIREVPCNEAKRIDIEEVSIFSDLVSRQPSKKCDIDQWQLLEHSTEYNTAAFTWIEGTLVLGIKMGDKLKSKTTRKSLRRPIGHWVIKMISFESLHRDELEPNPIDDILDAAHYVITRKFPESYLRSQCANTYGLSALLKEITSYVGPAIAFFKALNHLRGHYYLFSCPNSLVTVGFTSSKLMIDFHVQVDFSCGFRKATETLQILNTIGSVNKELIHKLVEDVDPGPEYIKEIADKIQNYLDEKERLNLKL